ncbi:hypothetical protein AT864_00486 [Anoxybacillus sp. P3H1B]|uniref:YczE/YyaS/YitT family protein n=1 Tax=Anoxybacillus sp. P3H1B TaxID=1769293 RepID=UPI0007992835|nr:YitT family protein [Anoxybacillus sp. P3H1B]KXG11403.1 hypothetical protein AT864_00486 [Anoxybacillus sp. P3H1B]
MKESIVRWTVYFLGLLVMSFGIVLTIKADMGSAPWDVLHIGLYRQLGLTIGTWSIIVGIIVLAASSLLSKQWPQIGAFLNMLLVGLMIDMYMMIPALQTPHTFIGKMAMLFGGIIITGYGMGLYISAKMGAGPRDSLMLVLMEKTGWRVEYIRIAMEVFVLLVGWILGGPVSIGTLVFSVTIGKVIGIALPQCQQWTARMAVAKTGMNGLSR